MGKEQIYTAKSTSLVVLLLILFASMGNKSCKQDKISQKSVSMDSSGFFIPQTPGNNTDTISPLKSTQNPKLAKVKRSQEQQPGSNRTKNNSKAAIQTVPDTLQRVPAFYPGKNTVRGSTKDNTGKNTYIYPLVLMPAAVSDSVEISELEKEFSGQKNTTPQANEKQIDTGSRLSPIASGKLSDNTGSSYFNAEVQANMSDQIKSVFTAKLLYDSVIATSNKDFIYNTLTVNNTTASKIALQVIIAGPKDWQMVTSKIVDLTLDPFESSIIPVRLTPSGSNTATWSQVRIEYRINNVVDTRKTFFKIKVQEYSSFKASLPNSNYVLTSYQKNNTIPISVKNSGNTPGIYVITAVNQLLKLSVNSQIELTPGKDTVFFLPMALSESQFSMLKKEDIRIAVTNERREVINLIQSVSKVGYVLKDHASAYLEMPLQLEAGIMYQGTESPIQYYGGLYGTLDLGEYDKLSMSFRSNTIAQGQTNNNSIIRLDYTGKHITASAGNVQGAGEFMVDGYGGRLGYEWKGYNKAELFAMLRSRVGDTKVGGGALQLKLNEKLHMYDALSFSKDNVRQMNSGILSQITEYSFEKGRLAVIAGIGGEKNDASLVEGTKNILIGTSIGYNFSYRGKHIAAVSNVLYNSNSYPGTFKGQRVQMHDLRWLIKNNFIGSYYEYNFRKQNYWQDTLFLENVFNLKTTNSGIRGGVNLHGLSVILAAGQQRQLQEGESSYETNYNYLNLNLSAVLFKKLFLSVNSFGGDMSTVNYGDHHVITSTTQGNIQYKTFGASFRYDKGPYYYQEFLSYIQKPDNYQRIIFSPFAEVRLLKKALSIRTQANYAKTLPADVSNTSILANVNYATKIYDFNVNGILPVGGNTANQAYVNAAVRVRLKAPFIPARKFFNLTLILFKDQNSNGIKDKDEEPIAGQTLSLNGDLFVSDADGIVIYKNTEKGSYKADFGFSSKLKGWIPNAGSVQYYQLNRNETIEVPYKVSRILSGQLIVEKDSLSNATFTPNNIKVTATGEKGEIFSTLTDENGEFYFNLPAGNYIVSLSEAAFGDQFKPIQFSQSADLVNNKSKQLYFDIKQKRRQINIKKK